MTNIWVKRYLVQNTVRPIDTHTHQTNSSTRSTSGEEQPLCQLNSLSNSFQLMSGLITNISVKFVSANVGINHKYLGQTSFSSKHSQTNRHTHTHTHQTNSSTWSTKLPLRPFYGKYTPQRLLTCTL